MSNKRNSRKFGEAKPAEDAAVADYETIDDSAADVATAGDDSAAGEAPEAGEEPETIVASVEASQDAAQELRPRRTWTARTRSRSATA